MTPQAKLKKMVADPEIVVAPGIYDAFGAMMAERAGFKALYISGASIAYTRLARPDIGLVGMTEVAAAVGSIRERTELPLMVDADTGYGNALNVVRTVKLFEREGASAIQLEDQTLPKRCGHLAGKTLVPAAEMVGKIKAALDARADANTMIVARTDAVAVEGLDAALERAGRYVEAGADMLFVEALADRGQMETATGRFKGGIPLMANMVEGGKTPLNPAAELREIGYSLVIFPGGLVRALAHAAEGYFASLAEHGTTEPFLDRMMDFRALNRLIGTDGMLKDGQRYDRENFEK